MDIAVSRNSSATAAKGTRKTCMTQPENEMELMWVKELATVLGTVEDMRQTSERDRFFKKKYMGVCRQGSKDAMVTMRPFPTRANR